MNNSFKVISKSLKDTEIIAEKLSFFFKENGGLVCMYGDIGAGKTALTSLCAKFLGVKEHVTSPSFVILNEYHSGEIDIYHFDLYRLENEGLKSILDELRTYSELKNALTVDVESMMLTFDFTSQNPEAQYILELFMAELEDYINIQTSFYGGRLEILSCA